MEPHRGILIDHIVAEGVGGLLFALGTAAVVLLAIPALRPVAAFSLVCGVLVAPLLHRLHGH